MNVYTTIIIGGGASGLMAACALCRGGAKVLILEKQNRVGRKLLSTGNGRCNLTNMRLERARYHGAEDCADIVNRAYSPQDVRGFFESLGLSTVEDEEGRVYPRSHLAAGVLDVLRLYAAENGCEILTECGAESLLYKKGLFTVRTAEESYCAKTVLVAAGGLAAPKLGGCADGYRLLESMGHTLTPRQPALAALKTTGDAVRGLKGQRLQCAMTLRANGKDIKRETGELLFDDAGLSGIAAMQLCRDCAFLLQKKQTPSLHLSILSPQEAREAIEARRRHLPRRPLEDLLTGLVGKRVGLAMLRAASVTGMDRPCGDLSDRECEALARVLTDWEIPVTGVQGFERAQVTAGGIRLQDFDPHTMESKRVPGLYAAGEVLDVDGDCGGYNLQWAWASALTAADAILRQKKGNE